MKIFLKNNLQLIFIVLFCIILTFIWFQDGKLLATGEEGLILANPARSVELYKYSWNEIGVGDALPGLNPMVPLLYFESKLVSLDLPVWIFQASIFFLLMLIGSLSIYYLTIRIINGHVEDSNLKLTGFIAAIFFILNPVSLFGVWYRFALSFMMFYNFAPLFFTLFIVGLEKKKYYFIVLLPLISLLFTFSFASPALPPLLWLLPFLYLLFRFRIQTLVYFSLMFGFWVIINFWWIYPYVVLSKLAFAVETDPSHAIGTLKANSQYYSVSNMLRLLHSGFVYINETFGSIYKTLLFSLFSWLIPITVLYGLLKIPLDHTKKFLFITMVILLFLVKGTQPPFGGVFLWLFNHTIFLQPYRNTFEKIGMILPIIYAPLFSIGLIYLSNKLNDNKKRIFLTISLLTLAVYQWPFFTGALTHFQKRDIRVEIPATFSLVNQSFPPGDHIIFSVPVMGGASGFYKWPSGYKGVDASEYLFDYPTITKFYDAKTVYGQLLIAESNGFVDHNLVGVAQIFSADIIAVRHDTDIPAWGYNLDALDRVKRMIETSNLIKVFESKEVTLWNLPKEKIVPVLYVPQKLRFVDSPKELIEQLENKQYDPKQETFICNNEKDCKPFIKKYDPKELDIELIPQELKFIKISPVKYEINIIGSQGRFLLVFNNTYHPGWNIYINNQLRSKDKHIIANGYANGFIIDKIGDFKVELKFFPEEAMLSSQKTSAIGISFGVVAFFVFIGYSSIRGNRQAKKKN